MNGGRVTLALVANDLVQMCVGWPFVQSCEIILAKKQRTLGCSRYCADVSVWLLGQTGLHLSN